MIPPPVVHKADGRERQIGVEIEFAGIGTRDAAEMVQKRFGGRVHELDPYRYDIDDTEFGTFRVELDSQYAHASGGSERETPPGDAAGIEARGKRLARSMQRGLSEAIGDISSLWVPVEIVAPPVPITRLPKLELLIRDLRAAGAQGTRQGLTAAFATQFNPEMPALDSRTILRHLKAFLLLSDRLRDEISLDVKRRLLPFVDPFPAAYCRKVADPGYWPDQDQLIGDYLDANTTRNRELDLLPLFAHIDADRVRARIDDPRIKARPTLHYRLPDTRLSDPGWGLITEWNRWVRVEQLAADECRLQQQAVANLAQDGWPEQDGIKDLLRQT